LYKLPLTRAKIAGWHKNAKMKIAGLHKNAGGYSGM
tara:strand:+ start:158 stop:265 length:108 start_codon:yes stop_codon:yes gene_type:complete